MTKKRTSQTIKTFKEDDIVIAYSSKAAYITGVNAAITFSASNDFFQEDSTMVAPLPITGKQYVKWGADNLMPNNILKVTEINPVASSALEHAIDVAFGSGIKMGKFDENDDFKPFNHDEIEKKESYKAIKQFFIDNDIQSVLAELLTDIKWFNQTCIEFIFDRQSNQKIASVSVREMMFSRWEEPNGSNIVENHLYSSKWGQAMTEDDLIITPVLDFRTPLLDLKRKLGRVIGLNGKKNKQKLTRIIYPIRMPTPGRKLYPRPYWYAIIESGWLDFANRIPEFKKILMQNILAVAFHVEISLEYFPRIFAKEGQKTKEEQEIRVKKEYSDIRKFLQGAENAGAVTISYFKITPDGKVFIPDIKITPIKREYGGEFIEDSHEASAMTYTAMRVHPNLVGTIPGKTSGSLSGSDKRELLRIEQSLQGRIRDRALMFVYVMKEINEWPSEVHFSITDIILTTLDQGKEVQKMNIA